MSIPLVPVDGKSISWPREVANAINNLAGWVRGMQSLDDAGQVFNSLSAAPSDPVEGATYYDTALHKVRTWDGTAWQDHW